MPVSGYARVSTSDQVAAPPARRPPRRQLGALRAAGSAPSAPPARARVFRNVVSGANRKRPELARALKALRRGDVLVVARLNRLARSVSHLLEIVEELERRGVGYARSTIPSTPPRRRTG